MTSPDQHHELRELMELYCENQISQQQAARLEKLAAADAQSLQFYLDYIELHGNLVWDLAAQSQPTGTVLERVAEPQTAPIRNTRFGVIAALAACLAVAAIATFVNQDNNVPSGTTIAGSGPQDPEISGAQPPRSVEPLDLPPRGRGSVDHPEPQAIADSGTPVAPATKMADAQVVAEINRLIQKTWLSAEIKPSAVASDDAWLRRATLNITGRIPSLEELQAARTKRSRAAVVDGLLADTGYARFWSTNWTNLLIGRSSERGVNRPGFEKFLRERFAYNAPWNETVSELISAEGSTEDNAATNFLVAHLNNQAVPATAVTARAFLGIQVQCTQCHDHPFNSNLKQDQFWTLNSFFKQTKRERIERDRAAPAFVLTSTSLGGATHYETRNGLMKSAFPEFGGRTVGASEDINRRNELARIVTQEDNKQLALSMVNRVWAHFFGHGFTSPIDDMGPHNPVSHPDLLNHLADQFRLSGFNLKKLITWIALCDAYGLDSQFAANEIDAPARGEMPLFSRMYVRSMSPEQVYDSLLVATQANQNAGFDWNTATQRRHKWIQQFLFAHRNEENTESSTFDGSITQALSLMNSELVTDGLSVERGTLLASIIGDRKSPKDQLTSICRAVLSRSPSESELSAFRKLLRRERTQAARQALLQDVLWAYLNSNEFILVH